MDPGPHAGEGHDLGKRSQGSCGSGASLILRYRLESAGVAALPVVGDPGLPRPVRSVPGAKRLLSEERT